MLVLEVVEQRAEAHNTPNSRTLRRLLINSYPRPIKGDYVINQSEILIFRPDGIVSSTYSRQKADNTTSDRTFYRRLILQR